MRALNEAVNKPDFKAYLEVRGSDWERGEGRGGEGRRGEERGGEEREGRERCQ